MKIQKQVPLTEGHVLKSLTGLAVPSSLPFPF